MSTETAENVAPETHAFQAEISQLLDIVIHSLYTNKEIFVRELVSNAADALEKRRHESLVNEAMPDRDTEPVIRIKTDSEAKRIEFIDTGIGMSREDLEKFLGTIASSGTRQFMAQLAEGARADTKLIGQFGVGFYSAFMVAKKVTVETRSYREENAPGWRWTSAGAGTYEIAPAEGLVRGTRIILELKEDAVAFAEGSEIKNIVRRFSNFVPFPVEVDGEKVNTVQAIWTRSKSEITDEEYNEFYRFIANAWDVPTYRLHFTAEGQLVVKALIFAPKANMESLGMGRMEPGVDLYCRKVLIQKHPDKLLPEWMRFFRGVVDCDDIPLNISRETMQDSQLMRKLSNIVAKRVIKFLEEESAKDAEKYDQFFEDFGRFIKEGVATDHQHRDEIAKLLRFETSATEKGKTASLTQYVARMKEGQKDIYYINGASREAIESGPYAEALLARGFEVIYCFDQVDDFVFEHLGSFEEKDIKSADRGDLELPDLEKKEGEELSAEETEALCGWLKGHYGDRIGTVRASKRLVNNPAVVVTDGGLSAQMQRLMAAMNKGRETPLNTMTLEINPGHAVVRRLNTLRAENPEFAGQIADQLADTALLAAGLLSDPRAMVERLNALLQKAAGV